MLRIRLTTIDGHQLLVDRKTAALAASLGALPAPAATGEARPYARLERYVVGDTLSHPKFGVGRVVSSEGPRIQVMFDIGAKTLAQAER